MWRPRYNHEPCKLFNEPDIVNVIKVGRLRWLGHLPRMQERNPCRKLTLNNPECTRRVGRPAIGWLDSIEEDLKKMCVRNWRRNLLDRDQWRAILYKRPRLIMDYSAREMRIRKEEGQSILLTAAAQVRCQETDMGLWKFGTMAGFVRVPRLPLQILIPPTAPYSLIIL
jgi:hypothetical protein